ncbi:MAG: RNA polymerase sigma factor [Prevotella sp.]|nr:RNA polymerase sigma factor [Prevotella sp.]
MTEETFQNEVQRLRPKLTALAKRYTNHASDAEDIVQDVFLKLWQMRDDLVSPPDGLALVLTRNLSIDHQRRKKPHYPTRDIAEEEAVEDERIERMMQAIDSLPSRHQIILRLRHLEGMEIRDIATLTSQTEAAVRKMLSRARKETLEIIKSNTKSNKTPLK